MIWAVPKIACVMMQKNEIFLLRPWLAYHGHLFGFENLYVLDNGSTSIEVRATLEEFARKGVTVDWDHASREDYLAKGELIGGLIETLDRLGCHDFLIPLDCDEFIMLRTDREVSCSREMILAYLATLADERRILGVPYQFANHPLSPDLYHRYEFFKVFFVSGTISPIDHGHHIATGAPDAELLETRIVHLHFHYKPFAMKIAEARRSWIGSVDVDDLTELSGYRGPSAHLSRFFLQDRDRYYWSFLEQVHFYLPRFRALLDVLGAPLNLPGEAVPPYLEMRVTEIETDANSAANGEIVFIPAAAGIESAQITTPLTFRATRFHEGHYLLANPGLVEAGVNPTVHFCVHGFKEGRPMRPALPPRA